MKHTNPLINIYKNIPHCGKHIANTISNEKFCGKLFSENKYTYTYDTNALVFNEQFECKTRSIQN